ncbi:trigger factor [Candidatus Contubernalis alkaliaceticus]|uniref:trigger factor n=1 Tax=Candidatus Contubernalis alkaliaceticus TaxID=338645 RepID=UPI001F4C4392|nr:trigger factor [Candidatus Contubernalis alkalaceticus]UNC90890.1 trigger factor [Candidatus Contubernalis alkalaceticus]
MTKLEKLDNNKVVLEVEVEVERLEEAMGKAYRKVVGKINVPGFRKGKVPRRVLEAKFGPEILYEEALEMLVPEAYEEALEELEIEPIDKPDVNIKQIEPGKPLIFEATVDVKPEVELGQYKGVEVDHVESKVTEEEVQEYLTEMQEKHTRVVVVEEGEAVQGSIVMIDFIGYLEGEPFEGGKAENYSLEIGSGTFIPGFEEQLIGCKQEEEKEIQVTFPEDYQKEELAGKEVTFKVTIKGLKQKEKPLLDDDFAKEVSDFDTLEEFRQDVLNKLKKDAEKKDRVDLEEKIIGIVTENSKVDTPEILVERELDRVISDFSQQLKQQGLTLEQYCQLTENTEQSIKEDNRIEADKRVRANLVLEAIMKQEDFIATPEDLEEKFNKMAQSYQQEPENIKEYFEKSGQIDVLKKEITFRKTVDFLVDEAKVNIVDKILEEVDTPEEEMKISEQPE